MSMSGFVAIWKGILSNPFTGFGLVTKDTKVLWPLVCLLILTALSTTLLLPITSSPTYMAAAGRVQLDTLSKRGVTLDEAQLKAMQDQLASPSTRVLTAVSAYAGALIMFPVTLLILALILKVLTAIVKASVPYKLLFAIVVFASIVTAVQGIVKAGITLAGDWEGALRSAQNTQDLKTALQSQLSLALLFPATSLGKVGSTLLDTATDIFTWITYVFIYAGLRSSAGLDKKQATPVILVTVVLFVAVNVGLTLLF